MMSQEDPRTIAVLLSSTDPAEIGRGLAMVRSRLPDLTQDEMRSFFDMISALFYIDPLDLPGHMPVLEDAIAIVADFGPQVIPMLIQSLEMGDVKAQMAAAQALGRIGAEAIDPLIAEYRHSCPEPSCHAFILYALGKVKSPRIVAAVPVALEAAASPDLELRDSATRALGKFAESIPPSDLPAELRAAVLERLRANLADTSPGIRSKAVRSLGKLARHRHLAAQEHEQLGITLRRLLGEDEHFDWDKAYVVRKEAKEALGYV
jgi:HEAT repeat protein